MMIPAESLHQPELGLGVAGVCVSNHPCVCIHGLAASTYLTLPRYAGLRATEVFPSLLYRWGN